MRRHNQCEKSKRVHTTRERACAGVRACSVPTNAAAHSTMAPKHSCTSDGAVRRRGTLPDAARERRGDTAVAWDVALDETAIAGGGARLAAGVACAVAAAPASTRAATAATSLMDHYVANAWHCVMKQSTRLLIAGGKKKTRNYERDACDAQENRRHKKCRQRVGMCASMCACMLVRACGGRLTSILFVTSASTLRHESRCVHMSRR